MALLSPSSSTIGESGSSLSAVSSPGNSRDASPNSLDDGKRGEAEKEREKVHRRRVSDRGKKESHRQKRKKITRAKSAKEK